MSELQRAVGSQQKWVVISKYLLTLGRPKADAGARWHRRGNYYSNCVTRPHIKFPMASQIVKDIKGIRPNLQSSRAQCTHTPTLHFLLTPKRFVFSSWCNSCSPGNFICSSSTAWKRMMGGGDHNAAASSRCCLSRDGQGLRDGTEALPESSNPRRLSCASSVHETLDAAQCIFTSAVVLLRFVINADKNQAIIHRLLRKALAWP